MNAVLSGLSLARARLLRRQTATLVLAALGCVALVSWLERLEDPKHAANHTLTGIAFGLAVPLFALAISGNACQGNRLDLGLNERARHGANRRGLTLGLLLGVALVLAPACALIGATAALTSGNWSSAAPTGDALTCGWIGFCAGIAYAGWYGLGSSLGRSGRGRGWLFVLDWLLGSTASLVALPLPRAHVLNLLGGSAPLALPQWGSTVGLLGLALVFLGLALSRVRP